MSRCFSLSLLLLLFCAPFSQAQQTRRIATPVSEFSEVQGHWNRLTNAVSSGRVYDFAIAMDTYERDSYTRESRVVFANPGDFDLLECWVGVAQQQHTGQTRFMIRGDGVLLYRSLWMNWRDPAEKVSVSIKGYKGISLIAEGTNMNRFDMAIWGEPVLVQTNPPQLDDASIPFAGLMTVRQFDDGGIDISVNGAKVDFGQAKPVNESSRLLVPIRPIFEALGARVSYNPMTRQIVATRGSQTIRMKVGAQSASINDLQLELDVVPRVTAGETMVSLRFVAEALGTAVEYKR